MMKWLFLACALFAAIWAAACEEFDEYDCDRACYRYQSCFDSRYDLANCEARCRSKPDHPRAAACRACLEDKSCVSATFPCVSPCLGIVP